MDKRISDIFKNSGYKLYYDGGVKGVRGEERALYYELRGKFGQIYPYSETQLVAQFYREEGIPVPTRFVKSKGYKVLQDADDLIAVILPITDFEEIAKKFDLKKVVKRAKKQLDKLKIGL